MLIIVCILTAASSVFGTFSSRFVVCCLFGVFLTLNASLASLNWWDTPWHFIPGSIVDDFITWVLCGLRLGFYLKPEQA